MSYIEFLSHEKDQTGCDKCIAPQYWAVVPIQQLSNVQFGTPILHPLQYDHVSKHGNRLPNTSGTKRRQPDLCPLTQYESACRLGKAMKEHGMGIPHVNPEQQASATIGWLSSEETTQ